MHLAFNIQCSTFNITRVKWGVALKQPAYAQEISKFQISNIYSKRDFQFMQKFAPTKISRYMVLCV